MYIATFFTHFGAQSFYAQAKGLDPAARMMPVPRALSASCGICVRFERDDLSDTVRTDLPEDLEALYLASDGGYQTLLTVED